MLIITLQNVKMDFDTNVADYEWKTYINESLLSQGMLYKHKRESGWEALITKLAEDLKDGKKNPPVERKSKKRNSRSS